MPPYAGSYWKIDTGDWLIDGDGVSAVIEPGDESAVLRIGTCDFGGGMSWMQLTTWAQRSVPAGTSIREVECGEFAGVYAEFIIQEDTFVRVWWLTLAELVLQVEYSCEGQQHKDHRAIVDRIVSSLVDNRA